jgi:hypothetical protein
VIEPKTVTPADCRRCGGRGYLLQHVCDGNSVRCREHCPGEVECQDCEGLGWLVVPIAEAKADVLRQTRGDCQ